MSLQSSKRRRVEETVETRITRANRSSLRCNSLRKKNEFLLKLLTPDSTPYHIIDFIGWDIAYGNACYSFRKHFDEHKCSIFRRLIRVNYGLDINEVADVYSVTGGIAVQEYGQRKEATVSGPESQAVIFEHGVGRVTRSLCFFPVDAISNFISFAQEDAYRVEPGLSDLTKWLPKGLAALWSVMKFRACIPNRYYPHMFENHLFWRKHPSLFVMVAKALIYQMSSFPMATKSCPIPLFKVIKAAMSIESLTIVRGVPKAKEAAFELIKALRKYGIHKSNKFWRSTIQSVIPFDLFPSPDIDGTIVCDELDQIMRFIIDAASVGCDIRYPRYAQKALGKHWPRAIIHYRLKIQNEEADRLGVDVSQLPPLNGIESESDDDDHYDSELEMITDPILEQFRSCVFLMKFFLLCRFIVSFYYVVFFGLSRFFLIVSLYYVVFFGDQFILFFFLHNTGIAAENDVDLDTE